MNLDAGESRHADVEHDAARNRKIAFEKGFAARIGIYPPVVEFEKGPHCTKHRLIVVDEAYERRALLLIVIKAIIH